MRTELDDLRYDDLLARARERVGATDTAWSDLRAPDPGTTVTELLAWQTATHAYQLGQVPADRREATLALLDSSPEPPTPATAFVSFSPSDAAAAGTRVPAGTGLRADGVAFETTRPVAVTSATVDRVLGAGESENPVPSFDPGSITEWSATESVETPAFRPFGTDPERGDSLLVAFAGDPFASVSVVSLSVALDHGDAPPPGDGDTTFVPSVSLDWEWWDGTAWRSLPLVDDGTDALYESGVVRLGRPEGWDDRSYEMPGPAGTGPSYWFRCRVREGGYEIPPRLSALSTNGVAVSQRRSVASVTLERVDPETPALDDQRYRFPSAPVQSAVVTVDGNSWMEVDSLGASGPDDRHYTLDRERGIVRFGGGFGGVAPPAEATVEARSVVYGGGTEGNLRDAEWTIRGETPSVSVDGRGASGGTDAETVADAIRRVRQRRSEPARAVTIADYETLAVGTPGVRISRATAHAHEGEPRVTVAVVPYTPPDCGRPEASDGLLAAVERHLDDVRLLTDRVTVVPPRYAPVDVSAEVRCRPRYAEADGRAVETAVRAYLDPLRGDDGSGWPFGGSLSVPVLRERIEALDAVVAVEEFSVTPYGPADRAGDVVRIDDRTLFWVASVEADCTVVSDGDAA